MTSLTRQLHTFLSACGGNWRNAVFISSCPPGDGAGYLLTADRDGCPVVMEAGQFSRLSGVCIDPGECCGHISEKAFEALYAQYLLWQLPSSAEHPLRWLCQPSEKNKIL